MDKKEIYLEKIAIAYNFLEDVDVVIERYKDCFEIIDKEIKSLNKKTNKFKGARVIILYIIVTLASLPLFGFVTLAVPPNIKLNIYYPFFTAIFTAAIKIYYEKKNIPIYENMFNNATKKKQEELNELSSTIIVYEEQAKQILKMFPDRVQHQTALQILYETIRQGYAIDIESAIVFYDKQLKKLEMDESEDSKKMIKIIADATEKINYRNKVFSKFANAI